MTKLNDPELERFRAELLSVSPSREHDAVGWPRISAVFAAIRTYLSQRYPDELPNFDALSREPAWNSVEHSARRPLMGIVEGVDEDRRVASLCQQNSRNFETARLAVVTAIESIDRYRHDGGDTENVSTNGAIARVKLLLDRFQRVADGLRKRHAGNASIELNDEYDVQFLLGGLLKVYFDDVEPESRRASHPGVAERSLSFVCEFPKRRTKCRPTSAWRLTKSHTDEY
jgi:hypothetical protein